MDHFAVIVRFNERNNGNVMVGDRIASRRKNADRQWMLLVSVSLGEPSLFDDPLLLRACPIEDGVGAEPEGDFARRAFRAI